MNKLGLTLFTAMVLTVNNMFPIATTPETTATKPDTQMTHVIQLTPQQELILEMLFNPMEHDTLFPPTIGNEKIVVGLFKILQPMENNTANTIQIKYHTKGTLFATCSAKWHALSTKKKVMIITGLMLAGLAAWEIVVILKGLHDMSLCYWFMHHAPAFYASCVTKIGVGYNATMAYAIPTLANAQKNYLTPAYNKVAAQGTTLNNNINNFATTAKNGFNAGYANAQMYLHNTYNTLSNNTSPYFNLAKNRTYDYVNIAKNSLYAAYTKFMQAAGTAFMPHSNAPTAAYAQFPICPLNATQLETCPIK